MIRRASALNVVVLSQAAIAGQGVVIVSLVLVADALASGLLVQPFPQVLCGDTYHFACPRELSGRPDVVAMRSWFQTHMARAVCRLYSTDPRTALPRKKA